MASEISLLRKLLSTNLESCSEREFVSNDIIIVFYCGKQDKVLYINHSNQSGLCLMHFNKFKLRIIETNLTIDTSDFEDYDDMSLVLKYGRSILDENIIQEAMNILGIDLNLSDFDAFLNQ